ncbi:MAG: DUF6352 family protein [Hyphomicrobiaceae bacterium]
MNDFWVSSGHHLIDRDSDGRLVVTDTFLKAYLARAEIVPPPEACLIERAIHQRLMREPRAPVPGDEIAHIADRDARENWQHFLAFRDHLLRHPTLEAAYVALARAPKVTTPPLFLNQLVHLLLRNILDGETDAFVLRAAEMFFRAQRLSLKDGVLLLADEEVVDSAANDAQASPLVAIFGDAKAKSLDVLAPETAPQYVGRSDAFDMVLDFRHGQAARGAFARVMERWVGSLTGVTVAIKPVDRIAEDSWAWFVGLDQDATTIGNALWRGEEPAGEGRERIVALFELTFADPREMLERVAGRPVSLILAMSPARIVRMKPQNLIAGLPLRTGAAAAS